MAIPPHLKNADPHILKEGQGGVREAAMKVF
jgi:hypothetical protein